MRDAGHRTPDAGHRTPDIGHRTAKKAKIIYPPPRGVDIITIKTWQFQVAPDNIKTSHNSIVQSLVAVELFFLKFERVNLLNFGILNIKTLQFPFHSAYLLRSVFGKVVILPPVSLTVSRSPVGSLSDFSQFPHKQSDFAQPQMTSASPHFSVQMLGCLWKFAAHGNCGNKGRFSVMNSNKAKGVSVPWGKLQSHQRHD